MTYFREISLAMNLIPVILCIFKAIGTHLMVRRLYAATQLLHGKINIKKLMHCYESL